MDLQELKLTLTTVVQNKGFGQVGIASIEPFTESFSELDKWFDRGSDVHLQYLKKEILKDPRKFYPEAQSALVGFFPYARPDHSPGRDSQAKIARYLWGPDYHHLLKVRLLESLNEVQGKYPELKGTICVDTFPILERHFASRAGIGWQGKNTLLIAGKDGSWGFLGVILLNVALPKDEPFNTEHCGTCTACLDACPTQALEPFVLNPNLCLTTYTIETEAEPPPQVLKAMEQVQWVAGCDICQEVCPWNQKPLWGDPALWGQSGGIHSFTLDQLPMGSAGWKRVCRGSALRRVSRRHWLKTLRRSKLHPKENGTTDS